ncbi:hypothetical protein L2E82_22175 [Cichorium intybus]|uniref:Uncharacterized protein n=1 Tax=Cichorium intybus TaxID=13427 RepID=A0ACB9DWW3_CICIN|nr:hypothetical protein L2E82_22175 [Cichorium intybus]
MVHDIDGLGKTTETTIKEMAHQDHLSTGDADFVFFVSSHILSTALFINHFEKFSRPNCSLLGHGFA